MPNPTPGDAHVNALLTNVSVATLQSESDFVAGRVFPTVMVDKQSDMYVIFNAPDFNRASMTIRAPGTESPGGGYRTSTDTYNANVWSLHHDIPDQLRANADSIYDLDRQAAEYLTIQGLIRREKEWARSFFTSGVWGTTITGVASSPGANQVLHWSDANSDPLKDVNDAKLAMVSRTGKLPNKMTIGYPVWAVLQNHPDIVDRIKYSGGVGPASPAIVTRAAVAALFEVDEVLVMQAIENTANEGLAANSAFIGGKHVLLSYSPPVAGVMVPSAGYHFSWRGLVGGGNNGMRIKKFRMEHLASDRVEIDMAFDMKLVSADLGYFFSGVVA